MDDNSVGGATHDVALRRIAQLEHDLAVQRGVVDMVYIPVRHMTARADKYEAKSKRLEAEAKDARYLVAALIKAAGGRVELTMATVMGIGAKDQITYWDDPISGNKVYVLTEVTTSDAETKSAGSKHAENNAENPGKLAHSL